MFNGFSLNLILFAVIRELLCHTRFYFMEKSSLQWCHKYLICIQHLQSCLSAKISFNCKIKPGSLHKTLTPRLLLLDSLNTGFHLILWKSLRNVVSWSCNPLAVRSENFLGNFKINHLTTKNTLQLVQLSGNNFDAEKNNYDFCISTLSFCCCFCWGFFFFNLKKPRFFWNSELYLLFYYQQRWKIREIFKIWMLENKSDNFPHFCFFLMKSCFLQFIGNASF